MISSVKVVGLGRVGTAVAARLAERGLTIDRSEPELVLLCVPDRAIAEVAASIDEGPWVAHVSGATSLGALDPHTRRFSLHPLQTFTLARGPEQLDGASAAVTAETDGARELGYWVARTLGLQPFTLADETRDATMPAPRLPRTISSPCVARPVSCSSRQALRHRRSSP